MESVSPTKNLSSEISLTLPSHPPEMSDLTNGETDHLTDPVTEVMVILYHWSQTGGFYFLSHHFMCNCQHRFEEKK